MEAVASGLIGTLADPVVVIVMLALAVIAVLLQLGGVAPTGITAAACLALAGAGLTQIVDGPLPVLLPAAVAAIAVLLAAWIARRARSRPPERRAPELIGETAVVRAADESVHMAFVGGAWWPLIGRSAPLVDGTTVEVIGRDGLRLIVVPQRPASRTGHHRRPGATSRAGRR